MKLIVGAQEHKSIFDKLDFNSLIYRLCNR